MLKFKWGLTNWLFKEVMPSSEDYSASVDLRDDERLVIIDDTPGFTYAHIADAGTNILKAGSGTLGRVNFNSFVALGVTTIYDRIRFGSHNWNSHESNSSFRIEIFYGV